MYSLKNLKSKDGRVIKPYIYQKSSFQIAVKALIKYHRALIVMATGLGKTITSILILLHFLKPKSRVLFLCHDTGILDQAYKEFNEFLGDAYSCTKFYGQKKDWNADTHNIVFATFQSLASHLADTTRKNIFSRKHFDYIIVDEAHHAKAETYETVLKYFICQWKMAMTATPEREDEESISEIFGNAVVNIELPEAIAKGWLTPVDYRVLSDGLNEEMIQELVAEVLEDNVRITEKQINDRIFVKVRTQEQIKEILKESKNKQTIVFCQNITHLRHVAELLPSSVWMHSKQTKEVNDKAMATFKQKKVRHILVVDKFNEGIDIPNVELIVFLRGTDSRRIFLQQLGRGLRKMIGKNKVTILDFVGNIRRIQEIKNLVEHIESLLPRKKKLGNKNFVPLHVEGKGFSFEFTNEIVNLMKVFDRSQEDFYPTWQEASKAAIELGIKNRKEYLKISKQDFKLPSSPSRTYKDFPRWTVFLGGKEKVLYLTWEEASKAAIELGIRTSMDYRRSYKKDAKLPANPIQSYPNFPGWTLFLGKEEKNYYRTWPEASKAVIKLKIKTLEEYKRRYKEDTKLPSHPDNYKNFPGWTLFLGKEEKNYYRTWQEASKAVIKLKIKNQEEYSKNYKRNIQLPSSPLTFFKNFPGWTLFLGKEEKSLYSTWQEASKAVARLGITSVNIFVKKRNEDPSLPSNPDRYYRNFPGWYKFFGKKKQ